MSNEDQRLFNNIREHLHALHTKWDNDPEKDGHCKPNEGYVGLLLSYPNWFEAKDYLYDEPEVSVEIYSYLFGPSRLHSFRSLQEAWDEVKKWSYELEPDIQSKLSKVEESK